MFGGGYAGDQNVKGILKKPSSVTFSNDVPQGIQANQAGVYIPMSQLPFIQNPNLSNQSNFQLQQPIRNLLDENFSQKSNNKSASSNLAPLNNNASAAFGGSVQPTIKNTEMSVMPMYNAKWKDGMIDAYKEQISQLSQAMYQLQVQNQQTAAVKAESDKNFQMSQGSLQEAMDGQRRMFDMYWELSRRCKHVEEVTKKQADLITSMNEMMERREAQHRREIDRLRDEIYRLRITKDSNIAPKQNPQDLNRHPSSAPTGRPFVESIEQFHHPQYPQMTPQRPPAYPKRHRVPRLQRHRDDSYYSNPEFSDRALSPKLTHALSKTSPNRRERKDSHDLYPDIESSDTDGDFARDQIRTKNKLKGIEGKIMELKLMTQDM